MQGSGSAAPDSWNVSVSTHPGLDLEGFTLHTNHIWRQGGCMSGLAHRCQVTFRVLCKVISWTGAGNLVCWSLSDWMCKMEPPFHLYKQSLLRVRTRVKLYKCIYSLHSISKWEGPGKCSLFLLANSCHGFCFCCFSVGTTSNLSFLKS